MSETGGEEPQVQPSTPEESPTSVSDNFVKDRQSRQSTVEQTVMGKVVAPVVTLIGGLLGTGAGLVAVNTVSEIVSKSENVININVGAGIAAGAEVAIAAALLNGAYRAGRAAILAYKK
ncbi:hypothetical protein HYT18_00605 [Candidatus Microgenomates bacterium]|nr:hypothetical protein [Candidatus Microgenomates bacterium]